MWPFKKKPKTKTEKEIFEEQINEQWTIAIKTRIHELKFSYLYWDTYRVTDKTSGEQTYIYVQDPLFKIIDDEYNKRSDQREYELYVKSIENLKKANQNERTL